MTFLQGTISGIPVWVWLIAGAGVIVAVIWWTRRNQSGTTSGVLGQNTTAAAVPNDPNIDPNTGVPYSIEEAINPATGLPSYYGGPGTTNNGLTGPTPSVQQASTRSRQLGGIAGQYDASNPQGVPFDTTPGQYASAGFVPYGTGVQLTGPAVQGPPNNPQIGDTTWYPATYNGQAGYLNAFDIAGYGNQTGGFTQPQANPVPPGVNNTGSVPNYVLLHSQVPNTTAPAMGRAAGSQDLIQATPFWPDMTDLSAGRH